VVGGEDEQPFMGHLAEGELLQAWSNNLFRAPIFRHDTSPTDFLLVRSKISGQTMHFVIKVHERYGAGIINIHILLIPRTRF
jgi:transcription initiation factor TFIID subunit 1